MLIIGFISLSTALDGYERYTSESGHDNDGYTHGPRDNHQQPGRYHINITLLFVNHKVL